MSINNTKELDDLINDISVFSKKASDEEIVTVLSVGASEFVSELKKIPNPKSQIKKSGYTHLIDSFDFREKSKNVEVGWGKHYGKMVEFGTSKMKAQPHFYPTWEKNKNKILNKMVSELYK